jgi:hypothetical protein
MKALYLLALVSAVALGTAFVLSFEAGITLFVMIGVTAIAVADYSRTYKPLAMADSARSHKPFAARPSHDLRLAV